MPSFLKSVPLGLHTRISKTDWPDGIDIYRLRRTLELKVHCVEAGHYRVTGGLDPHQVFIEQRQYHCDCADAAKGHRCKHVLAVRLAQRDKTLTPLVKQLNADSQADSLDLLALWENRHVRTA